jgi:hypothetical protein
MTSRPVTDSSRRGGGEERNEEMLRWIIKRLDPESAQKFISEIDEKYPKK